MGVAEHLGIDTAEYDRQILTLIPYYDDILDAAAQALDALDRPALTLVDLGTGSGALAGRCVSRLRTVQVVGIDADDAMLRMAARRLGRRLTAVVGNFETTPIPTCDVITASFALHHVPTRAAKARVFAKAFAALRPGGLLVDADCLVPTDARLRRQSDARWRAHLASVHGRAGARKFLSAWAREDTYFPLELEMRLLHDAGFLVDVVWRRDGFAVLAAAKRRRAPRSTPRTP